MSQFWPIICRGSATRRMFAGPPQIQPTWHKLTTQGQLRESSVTSANFALMKEKSDLQRAIQQYIDLNQVCTDAKPHYTPRGAALSADISTFLGRIHVFMSQISALQQALQKNNSQLSSILANNTAQTQRNLNALANFMQVICNLGLPPLPSLPAYFGASIFSFNGFSAASLSAVKTAAQQAAGAAAGNLSGGTGLNSTGGATPAPLPKVSAMSFTNFSFSQCSMMMAPNSNAGVLATPPTVVPFDGATVGATTGAIALPAAGTLGDPTQLTDPAYIISMQNVTTTPVFNPVTLSPATLLVGSLPNPVEIISNYQMPATTYVANILSTVPALATLITDAPASVSSPDSTVAPTAIQAEERKLLIEYVNLAGIVASNYDKNLTATWLMYIQAARSGRAGAWLPNFEDAYTQYITPSLTLLQAAGTVIPWNTVLGGTGTVAAPADIPLVDTIMGAPATVRQNILWKLSYIEASLLGYARNPQFDSGADQVYLSSFTGSDTDYISTPLDTTVTLTVVLGADTATYPVSCTFPASMANTMNAVIVTATANIAQAPAYTTPYPQFRFTYDAYAQATQVDRFTQFWRTFNYNVVQLLAQDLYTVGFVTTYPAALDSAVDPLGNPADYLQIENDASTRNRLWAPGLPLLTIPQAPVIELGALPGITGTTTGWSASNFDPQSFLDRPDIQALPLSTQLAMLRTNESYAAIMTASDELQSDVGAALAESQAALAALQNNGFSVDSGITLTVAPSGPLAAVVFDQTSYDNTNYVTSPTLFTIQAAGLYMIAGLINWDKGPAGVRTLLVMQNSTLVIDEEQTLADTVGPVAQSFSVVQQFNAGDTIQILVSQATGTPQNILPGAQLSCLLVPASQAVPSQPFSTTAPMTGDFATRSLTADASMVAGVAVEIQADGGVLPIDPVGAIATPFVDGISTTSVAQGALADVGTSYGSFYQLTDFPSLVTGGLVYAGVGGILTQNYPELVQSVNWVIVVGRAISPSVILFEPQIPTKVITF